MKDLELNDRIETATWWWVDRQEEGLVPEAHEKMTALIRAKRDKTLTVLPADAALALEEAENGGCNDDPFEAEL